MNITSPFVFKSTHKGLSYHKCKKKLCHYKVLGNFHIKSLPYPHYNGRGSRNQEQLN